MEQNIDSVADRVKRNSRLSFIAMVISLLCAVYYPLMDIFKAPDVKVYPGSEAEVTIDPEGFPDVFVFLRIENLGTRVESIGKIELSLRSKNDNSYERTFLCEMTAAPTSKGNGEGMEYIPYTGITIPVDEETTNWYKLKEEKSRNSRLKYDELFLKIANYNEEEKSREKTHEATTAYYLPPDLLLASQEMYKQNIDGLGEGEFKGEIRVYNAYKKIIVNCPFETTIFARDFQPIKNLIDFDLQWGYNLYWKNTIDRTAHIKLNFDRKERVE